jgi:23S rRNA (adenine2030-N6)-methyltransferase
MFSYRHAFHAGNHADVLKHAMLVCTLQYLTQKDTALQVIDTHAGVGLYKLDSDQAHTSGEAASGILTLLQSGQEGEAARSSALVKPYLDLVRTFQPTASAPVKKYPGSPLLTERLLRPQDRLHAFEVHPTDQRLLRGMMAEHDTRQLCTLHVADGFAGVKALLPPPSRRGLLVCDPSYELKTDYGRVTELVTDTLKRFATGCIFVWHPIVARPEAHDLPRKLKNAATRAGKPWLHATLSVKSGSANAKGVPVGLSGSGVFIVNPPFVLEPALREALPLLSKLLAQDAHAQHTLETSPR